MLGARLGEQAGRTARRWALGERACWACRACARLGVLGTGAAGAGAQATAARGRGACRRASSRHAGCAGKRQGAVAGAGAHDLGVVGRWAQPGFAGWLRAVHSVHLAHFRSVLTRYFPESNFLDIVRELGS